MSHHRRARHVFGVAVCIAVLGATTGCRNSPFYRHGDERPKGPDGKPVGFQEPLSPLDQASAAPARKPSSAKAPSAVAMAAVAAPVATVLVAATPAPVPAPPTGGPSIAPAETPMLDAALKRVESIESEQRRLMRAEANAPEPAEKTVKAVILPTPIKKPADKPSRDDAVQLAGADAPAAPVEVDKTKLWNAAAELVELLPADLSAAAVPAALPKAVAMLAGSPALAPTGPGPEPAPSKRDQRAKFGVNAVQLCREIHGFGSFEPMDAQALRAGRPFLIYSEPTGLRYERQGDEYVAHVATRVELIDARDGSKAWEVLGEAEDRCRRRRHDSFVSTLVNLPQAVAPGPYTIRLTQTDDLARESATAELAVTIGR